MAETLVFYLPFLRDIFKGTFDVETHSLKGILCTSSYTPNITTHATLGDVTNQLSTGNGYTQNNLVLAGVTITIVGSEIVLDCENIEWEASGGVIGPARYLVIYDDDADDKLVGYVDFGANRTASDGSYFRIRIHDDGLATVAQTA